MVGVGVGGVGDINKSTKLASSENLQKSEHLARNVGTTRTALELRTLQHRPPYLVWRDVAQSSEERTRGRDVAHALFVLYRLVQLRARWLEETIKDRSGMPMPWRGQK